jgi:hypothetical protein
VGFCLRLQKPLLIGIITIITDTTVINNIIARIITVAGPRNGAIIILNMAILVVPMVRTQDISAGIDIIMMINLEDLATNDSELTNRSTVSSSK